MSASIEPEKRNIEIKARLAGDAAYEKRVATAKKLTNTDGIILNQRDVFYKVANGRLKLRMEVCFFVIKIPLICFGNKFFCFIPSER